MKRNFISDNLPPLQQMVEAFTWFQLSAPELAIAAYVDDGSVPEDNLLECLSTEELAQADSLSKPTERRHFVVRRSFQRLFLSLISGWSAKPKDLAMQHKLDTRPYCADFPTLQISFSTSGATALACASTTHVVGIDVERVRPIENVSQLAERFFSSEEAAAIAALPGDQQNQHFLLHWTAKEAGLKAIGKGIVSGLNAFSLMREGHNLPYKIIGPAEKGEGWSLQHIEMLPLHIIAVVQKNSVDKFCLP